MFARLLCSVICTIDRWKAEYPFDRKQRAAVQELRDMIEVEEVNDDAVKEAIHRLGVALFCKKRRNLSKGDFTCPVYISVSGHQLD